MREELLAVLADAKPGFEFEGKTGLVDGGYLDSFDIITLVTELNDKFDIDIPVEEIITDQSDIYQTIEAYNGEF
jgi:acyl carrier protein